MALFPIKKCAVCGEEYELKPDHPGFANRCRDCNEDEAANARAAEQHLSAAERRSENERNAHRREAMRNLLYRKDS